MRQSFCGRHIGRELFNNWGGRGYDGSVPGEVTKTVPSGVRTTSSPTWSASLSRIQLITLRGWSNMFPVGAILVPSPSKRGQICYIPSPLNRWTGPGPDDTPVYIVCPNPNLKKNNKHNILYNTGTLPPSTRIEK